MKEMWSSEERKTDTKIRGFQFDELEKKRSNLQRKRTRKTYKVEDVFY